jgi:polyphosphate kinase
MTKKRRGQTAEPDTDALAEAIASFDMESDKLAKPIKEAAFGSGGYPYDDEMDRDAYEERLQALHIELLKVQDWAREAKERVVIVFEGRDGAGKGGAIKRFTQHLNPRVARVVALSKPSEAERGQWYFQRYIAHLPTRGEIAIFDRSWYNRSMVEPVNGFCTPEETSDFLHEAPAFERMMVRDGVKLFKIFVDIGQAMQLKRLHKRHKDPLRRWKLSPIDFKAVHQWDAYSAAIERMFGATHLDDAPWHVVMGNDKLRARLAIIELVLFRLDYPGKDVALLGSGPDPMICGQGGRFFDQDDHA